jgi:hypothetical protein
VARGVFVETSIWEELEHLSPEAALFYLWSFTNSRCNMSGLYVVSERSMLESKVPARKLPKVLEELEEHQMTFYRRPYLWVKARVKRLHSKTPNYAKSIANDVKELDPDHPLRVAFLRRYSNYGFLTGVLDDLALESQNTDAPPIETGDPLEGPNANASVNASRRTAAQKEQVADAPPVDLAPDLLERLPAVKAVLDRIVEVRGATSPPTLLSLGRVLASMPLRDHVAEAEKLEHWLCHGEGKKQQNRDPVARYRRWLERAPEVVAPSRAAGAAVSTTGQNVVQLNRQCASGCGREVRPGYGAHCEPCSEAIVEGRRPGVAS